MVQDSGPGRHLGEVILGRYLIDFLLGVGSFAWVYRARSREGEVVAVKVLHAESLVAAKRFARETAVLRSIPPSPGVVRYVAHGLTRTGAPFLVLEHVDGVTLKMAMRRGGRRPARRSVEFLAQLCRAIAPFHRLGVVHRDLKPANVILCRDGGIKLIDFGLIRDAHGILKLLEDEDGGPSTFRVFAEELDRGVLTGSVPYMAPEQFADFLDRSEVRVDTASDVYSLGVILYELLSGARPVRRGTTRDDAPIDDLLEYARWRVGFDEGGIAAVPGVDEALETVLRRALDHDPRQRQPDGGVLMQELLAYLWTGVAAPEYRGDATVEADLADVLLEGGRAPGAAELLSVDPPGEGGVTEVTPTRLHRKTDPEASWPDIMATTSKWVRAVRAADEEEAATSTWRPGEGVRRRDE